MFLFLKSSQFYFPPLVKDGAMGRKLQVDDS